MIFRFVHALPNAWLPAPNNTLHLEGISAAHLREMVEEHDVVSHVRYDDHAQAISEDLGINLPASGENAPNPFNSADTFVVAVRSPGTVAVQYIIVRNAWQEQQRCAGLA